MNGAHLTPGYLLAYTYARTFACPAGSYRNCRGKPGTQYNPIETVFCTRSKKVSENRSARFVPKIKLILFSRVQVHPYQAVLEFSGIQFPKHFIEFDSVETNDMIRSNSNVTLTRQTCSQTFIRLSFTFRKEEKKKRKTKCKAQRLLSAAIPERWSHLNLFAFITETSGLAPLLEGLLSRFRPEPNQGPMDDYFSFLSN